MARYCVVETSNVTHPSVTEAKCKPVSKQIETSLGFEDRKQLFHSATHTAHLDKEHPVQRNVGDAVKTSKTPKKKV